MTNIDIWLVVAFVLYLGLMIGIGVYFSRKSDTMNDYFLGGRSIGSWATAFSAQASDMSSWLLMALPGAICFSGVSQAWIAIGLALGTYFNWLLVAKRLRAYSAVADDSITVPHYFQNRFKPSGIALRVICAVVIFVFFLIYTASSFNAAGKLINSVFGIEYKLAVTIGAVIILLYTFLGGYFAVVWTDFIQGLLMFAALLLVPIITYFFVKTDFSALIADKPHFLSLVKESDGNYCRWQDIVSNLAWGLGYFGMPHILVRFMSIKSTAHVKKSRIIAMIWVIITLAAAVAIGVFGYAYLKTQGIVYETSNQAEMVFITLVQKVAPSFVAGILLCAVIAAIMSTSDSQMLVTASAVSNDIYRTVFDKKASEKTLLNLSRVAVVVVAVIACAMALNPDNSVMDLVSYAWAGFGAAFGPAMLVSLYWKRMNLQGAYAGIISGGITVVLWKNLFAASTGIYELVPGFVISLIFIVVVSLITKAPEKAITDMFDEYKRELEK
jgi:sodium/proline symporter